MSIKDNKIDKYDESSIKVLKGLDAVRKRPAMYIGNTEDISGLHQMFFEVLDNSVDEALAGYCDNIQITLYKDGAISVSDNGRGIPIGQHASERSPVPELILTVLHAGGKFDHDSYAVSGGLHGVGVSVVNALSSNLEVVIKRDNKIYTQNFKQGIPSSYQINDCLDTITGTYIKFYPDPTIFTYTDFEYPIILNRIKEISYLNPKINFTIYDQIRDTKQTIQFAGGIQQFIDDKFGDSKICPTMLISKQNASVNVQAAFTWTEISGENIFSFTNNIFQKDGGTHLIGFKSGISKSISNLIQNSSKQEHKKLKLANISSEDIREGICGLISIRAPDTTFSSQTKDKLVSAYIRTAVDQVVSEFITTYMSENPLIFDIIAGKIYKSFLIKEAGRRAKEMIKKSHTDNFSGVLPGKLTPCQTKDPTQAELFLVEGDSAGATAKGARSRFNQAILPLKGKILNVEKASEKNINKCEEVAKIVISLGCGWGNNINIDNIRYNKVIIMTDADNDGLHIRCLLLTMFFRYMYPIIEKGYVYIAQPPLYSVKKGSNEVFLKDDAALNAYFASREFDYISIGDNQISQQRWHEICEIHRLSSSAQLELKRFYPNVFVQALFDLEPFTNTTQWWDNLEQYCNKNTNNTYKVCEIEKGFSLQELRQDTSKSISTIPITLFESSYYYNILDASSAFSRLNNINIKLKDHSMQFDKIVDCINWLDNYHRQGAIIKRYKGLGTLNTDQLWKTTMDPEARIMIKVNIQDAKEADKYFTILMGENVEPRKEYIISRSQYVKIDV